MKKFIVLLIMLAGFFSSDLNAQSCCTPIKECKPAVCCPTAPPSCCKDTKSIKVTNAVKESAQQKQSIPQSQPIQPAKKREKLAVANKKE